MLARAKLWVCMCGVYEQCATSGDVTFDLAESLLVESGEKEKKNISGSEPSEITEQLWWRTQRQSLF